MHREYTLPKRLRTVLTPEHAEGIKALVRGLHLIGSLEVREYAAGAPPAGKAPATTAATAAATAVSERHVRVCVGASCLWLA